MWVSQLVVMAVVLEMIHVEYAGREGFLSRLRRTMDIPADFSCLVVFGVVFLRRMLQFS